MACDLVYQNDWKGIDDQDQRVHALSELLQKLPLHPVEIRGPKFRNPNGVSRKTYDFATHHPDYQGSPTNGGVGDLIVLQEFLDNGPSMSATAVAIREGVESGRLIDAFDELRDIDELEDEAIEGRLLERRHFARERSRDLRAKKIEQYRQSHSSLACEVCEFDFGKIFGAHGDGYIECHHVVPLHSSGETKTRLADLILICGNCHRMIHHRNPWLTPAQLRVLVADRQDR